MDKIANWLKAYIDTHPFDPGDKVPTSTTIHDRFKRIVSGDTVPLSLESTDDTMAAEYVCSTAGKEET